MAEGLSRREVLRVGGMIAVGLVAPPWLSTIARADMIKQEKGGKVDPDCILVVCQLSGGNDGLNTVVPWANARYRELRPTLAISESDVLKLNETMGLHPSMAGLASLYKAGKVAIIQNVGYPNPNRSHFKSMDIWQSASPSTSLKGGWVGRYMDSKLDKGPQNPVVAMGLSTEKPLALQASHASIPCFASLADIRTMVGDPEVEKMLRDIQGSANANDKVVQDANKAALDAMSYLRDRLAKFTPKQQYGTDRFGEGFKQVAQILACSPMTRVVYFQAGGFDTHANQPTTQANLLKGFSDGVTAFQAEMETLGLDKKVVVMVFSEFGRRCYENASSGTDHGAAAPMFLIGSRVKGGFYGEDPDLDNLQNGDLAFKTDFRQIYATALDHWMGGDSELILAEKFPSVDLFRA
ncbi:MAG: DUF1501 domain-containing protein [Armatimonadetes bacterium]|nr:DUF1501 domain-containing protein [Armatimonadota bacterium]